ncbi:hypothetical protein ACE0DR_01025 [Azotobacter sp. CWF10]
MQVLPQTMLELPKLSAIRTVTVRITRDGEQTDNIKTALLLTKNLTVIAVFSTAYQVSQVFLASAIDGARLLLATDDVAPAHAAARYPTISEDVTLSIDLNDGTGGGATGQSATLAARVRVDGVDVSREVLALERQTDGAWRIAGNLRTADGALDLQVTGGQVYAMALDDYGYVYQPNLGVSVGDTIRPTVYAGWLYRITEAGTLPATEPEWWPVDGDNAPRQLGTARAVAVRYHRPLAHGPVPVETI